MSDAERALADEALRCRDPLAHAAAHDAEGEIERLRAVLAEVLDPRRWQDQEVTIRGLRQDGAILHATTAELADWRARADNQPTRGPAAPAADTTPRF